MKITLDRVNTVTKRLANNELRTYYYHRDTGKRIAGEPGSLAFLVSYEEAARPDENTADSFNTLILAYQASAEFDALAPRSKEIYRRLLSDLSEKWGAVNLDALQDRRIKADILEWRDQIVRTGMRAKAQHIIATMKTVLAWAEQRGMIDFNRLRDTPSIYKPSRADRIWRLELIEQLFKHASTEMQWVVCLALTTLQRQGDLLKLTWPKGDALKVRQQKTGAEVIIPVIGSLETLLSYIPKNADTIITSSRKRPWAIEGFKRRWHETINEAGLAEMDLHFHDLRGTAITCLADQGATEAEIAALSGHTLPSANQAMKGYLSRTTTQASNAMNKLQASWIGELPTILQTKQLSH